MADRREDARLRAEMADNQAQAEARAAQKLIDHFIADATDRGIQPVELRATTPDGHRVRTNRLGWYIRRNETIAIGTDGGYYVLTLAARVGLVGRMRAVQVDPALPSLTVGRGGRDGETGDLQEFLDWRLADG